ncbi:hypothetical protein KBZ08_10145 [Cyanobium sp. Candia 9D4]|nr:hypothetical protein [Cyanobium sp. Candia 9D4]
MKVLEKSFAGIPAGARMLVVTPRIVDAEVCEIAPGSVMAAATLRQRLTARHGADDACPATTGIALRVVAERSYLRLQAGVEPVTPFWRALDPESDLAGKLACGREFLRHMRSAEAPPLRTGR